MNVPGEVRQKTFKNVHVRSLWEEMNDLYSILVNLDKFVEIRRKFFEFLRNSDGIRWNSPEFRENFLKSIR